MATSSPGNPPAQGDVVVVPFPYADRLAEKRRPAVVVSTEDLHAKQIVWLAMVTSAENAGWSCDIRIENGTEAGLRAESVIRPWKLATVDLARIIRIAGHISDRERAQLVATIKGAVDY